MTNTTDKARDLVDALDRYYNTLPYTQIGYLLGVVRELALKCPIGEAVLDSHLRHIEYCQEEVEKIRKEKLAQE